MHEIVPVRRALLSVSDKTGLIELARVLAGQGVHLLASGGTRTALTEAGLEVTEVSAYTGQPEILGGRVKTLHPKLHGGILARREIAEDLAALEAQGIEPIDLVVVNLYPFEATVARAGVTFEEAVENIDIGGPSLIRGAAKNHAHVAVLTDADQYESLAKSLQDQGGTTLDQRKAFALAAFAKCARYDQAIAEYLGQVVGPVEGGTEAFPPILNPRFERRTVLRYGENPHQRAAFYVEPGTVGPNLATAQSIHGKELSYNNLLDLDSALRLIRLFAEPAATILKHNNPCGAAIADNLAEAFELAYEGDPVSAFGGIVGLNRRLDRATAERLCVPGRFIEAIVAPGYDPDALALLTTKPTWKNSVRLLDLGGPIGPDSPAPAGFDLRRVEGGMLVQDWDTMEADPASGTVPTQRTPTPAERVSLGFAWRICQSVRSNAIVLVRDRQLVGVGAGQMSRLDSVRIAVTKAGDRAQGAVLASDAFFPFRDGPDTAASAGVTALIQPGGSKRDNETLAACDEHQMAMILTGRRHFRH
ncbi:phosphoribosylaminoimidazolecarboxamide formyltransferase / IMP cyclohydrolase [Singulisphaera sp. GP187]|uniref:bifunctional phosphoribosylaminoimidazolecarboxamide formyltransferase/IMP cyclohydrolase n=1 Tax=Singulisphaera sp. GP187 TaxID=1882752 RepID=UPI000927EBB4|nr:bifunctional phosphoribosylaminoimidazolecarboxamide formyltransferase/IMP cyclohydrolase [Singulisphaera sp. GP187]SIO18563.1 phosphoribosylaminoimidazolecarboxamide formyltransferase / IMP cyclohydrolase [Singulisphaera sp. GP187]